jgi:hypothetical protein
MKAADDANKAAMEKAAQDYLQAYTEIQEKIAEAERQYGLERLNVEEFLYNRQLDGAHDLSVQLLKEQDDLTESIRKEVADRSDALTKYSDQQRKTRDDTDRYYDQFQFVVARALFSAETGGKHIGRQLMASIQDASLDYINHEFTNALRSMLSNASVGSLGGAGGGVGGFISSLFGGEFWAKGAGVAPDVFITPGLFRNGGDFAAGQPIIVGDKGPELMVPRSAGQLSPMASSAAASPLTSSSTARAVTPRSKTWLRLVLHKACSICPRLQLAPCARPSGAGRSDD